LDFLPNRKRYLFTVIETHFTFIVFSLRYWNRRERAFCKKTDDRLHRENSGTRKTADSRLGFFDNVSPHVDGWYELLILFKFLTVWDIHRRRLDRPISPVRRWRFGFCRNLAAIPPPPPLRTWLGIRNRPRRFSALTTRRVVRNS